MVDGWWLVVGGWYTSSEEVATLSIILVIWQQNCRSQESADWFLSLPASHQPAVQSQQSQTKSLIATKVFLSLPPFKRWSVRAAVECKYISNKGFSDFSRCSTLYCLFNKIDKIFKTDIIFASSLPPSLLSLKQYGIIIF